MGKMITFITFFIFIDFLFIMTGQVCNTDAGCSLSSTFFNMLLDIQSFTVSSFFTVLLGNFTDLFNSLTGVAALAVGGVVTIGAVTAKSENVLFIPIGLGLALIGMDMVFIISYIIGLNFIIGTIIGVLLLVPFIIVVLDWMKNKD